jgi:predicted solute-binding protein
MEPNEIWELIVSADELLKYATEEKAAVRRTQAAEHLKRAEAEALAIGNTALVEQARTRLRDLGEELH